MAQDYYEVLIWSILVSSKCPAQPGGDVQNLEEALRDPRARDLLGLTAANQGVTVPLIDGNVLEDMVLSAPVDEVGIRYGKGSYPLLRCGLV